MIKYMRRNFLTTFTQHIVSHVQLQSSPPFSGSAEFGGRARRGDGEKLTFGRSIATVTT